MAPQDPHGALDATLVPGPGGKCSDTHVLLPKERRRRQKQLSTMATGFHSCPIVRSRKGARAIIVLPLLIQTQMTRHNQHPVRQGFHKLI